MKKVTQGSIAVLGFGAAFAVFNSIIRTKKFQPKADDKKLEQTAPANFAIGEYTFLAGMLNGVPVDLTVSYDPEKYFYKVINEDFPAFTSSPEVAVISGEEISLQIEGMDILDGKTFDDVMMEYKEKFKGFDEFSIGDLNGYEFINGDNACIALPIDFANEGWLLVTVIKENSCKESVDELTERYDVASMVSSITLNKAE